MGGAILTGLASASTGGIAVTNRTTAKADAIRIPGVESLALDRDPDANARAIDGAGIVLVAVKPAMIPDLLESVRDALDPAALVVSVAVGVTAESMERIVPNRVLRAMPNTPATVGLGVTGVAPGSRADDADTALVVRLFEAVGQVVVVPEGRLDALSAISGSGPAYVFLLIEELERAARALGFDEERAAVMARGTFRGATELLAVSGEDPAELRRRVTSPKGTTERAIAVLQDAGLADTFERAADAAIARARELAAS